MALSARNVLRLIFSVLRLICKLLFIQLPNIVKLIKHRAQNLQGPLAEVVSKIVKLIKSFAQYLQKLLFIQLPNIVKQIYLQLFKHRAQNLQQDEVDSSPQKVSVGLSKAVRLSKMVIGNDMNCHEDFLRNLGISPHDAAYSVDQSDVIIAFVPIVSRAGTDIEAALKKIPENIPAVLVGLHHTYDPDYTFPDSRRAVNSSNVFAVDCLFHEDKGLHKCLSNTKALEATANYLQDIKTNYNLPALKKVSWSLKGIVDYIKANVSVGLPKAVRLSKMVIGNDMNCHKDFLKNLGISPQHAVDQSDVIIAFVPIVSRARTDIEAALKKIPENIPAVLVGLHHTYDPDCIFPDSRRAVSRSNVFAVDCLFHEDNGLHKCLSNTKALEATAKYLQDIKTN